VSSHFKDLADEVSRPLIKESNDDSSTNNFRDSIRSVKVNPRFYKRCGWPSILIVDDQFINRYIITQYWAKFDIQFAEAEHGQQALDVARNEANKLCWDGFQLILMDLNMPILGGIEASKLLMNDKKKHYISQDTKIIAITAFPNSSLKAEWIAAGMSDYKTKPFSFEEFYKLIRFEDSR